MRYLTEYTDASGEKQTIVVRLSDDQIADVERQRDGGPAHPLALTYARMNTIQSLPRGTRLQGTALLQ
jgi:hypothetical protein